MLYADTYKEKAEVWKNVFNGYLIFHSPFHSIFKKQAVYSDVDPSFQLWRSEFLKALGITSHDSNYYIKKNK